MKYHLYRDWAHLGTFTIHLQSGYDNTVTTAASEYKYQENTALIKYITQVNAEFEFRQNDKLISTFQDNYCEEMESTDNFFEVVDFTFLFLFGFLSFCQYCLPLRLNIRPRFSSFVFLNCTISLNRIFSDIVHVLFHC